MDLSGTEASGDVEDRRGMSGKTMAVGGGIGAIVLSLIGYFAGIDLNGIMPQGGNPARQQGEAPKDGYDVFCKKIIKTTNDVWDKQFDFHGHGMRYEHPKMELFSEGVDSGGCGYAPSAVGPFYCPASRKVFLDPTFFDELKNKLGGDNSEFTQGYVIAHEVGHHVQNLLGYNKKVDNFRSEGKNAGVRLELQADYLAGVWAHDMKDKLKIDGRDIDSAVTTAQAIGDDRIQKKMQGKAWPESFTHGSAEQRVRNFKRGFDTGDASKKALDHFFDPGIPALKL